VVEEEDLISAPKEVIGRCLTFLGVSPDMPFLEGYAIERTRNSKWPSVLTEEEQRSTLTFVNERSREFDDLIPGKAVSESYTRMITEALESRRPA
jgi:hypothetical protein